MVIGGGSQIGERCTILHNVTLGERRPDQSSDTPDYPIIGDDCMIGNSAVLLGRIKVGSGSRIGAGAIVLNDVEQGTTVVGNPARPTTKKRNQT
jgi:serine O-acetyltransferase